MRSEADSLSCDMELTVGVAFTGQTATSHGFGTLASMFGCRLRER